MKHLLLFFALLSSLYAGESILFFKSDVVVHKDGWYDVTETIKVRVEGNQIKRGIYRDFPQTYKMKWGLKEKRPFEVSSVTRNGKLEPYTVLRIRNGSRVRTGQEDVMLPVNSEQEYQIKYRTNYQLITKAEGADEFNWNVTGNAWAFPIDQVECTVTLPEGIAIEKAFARTGEFGAKGENYQSSFEASTARFSSDRVFKEGEGMTVIVRWPTGFLDPVAYEKPSIFESNRGLVFGMILVLLGILFYILMWVFVGRDPAKGVIIPRWEPPKDFSPGGVRYLWKMAFDNRCFSAGILGLASQGKLKLQEKKNVYSITKEDGPPPLHPVEGKLYDKIFAYKKKVRLAQSAHKTIARARNAYARALESRVDRSYFLANFSFWIPGLVVGVFGVLIMLLSTAQGGGSYLSFVFLIIGGITCFQPLIGTLRAFASRGFDGLKSQLNGAIFAAVFLTIALGVFIYNAGVWVAVCFVIVFLASVLFHHLMKRPTKKGRQAMDEIEGFREYLKVAEEDRLNLENPPEKTPELFEKFLPFALALDVEQEWSEKFDEVLKAAGATQSDGHYRPHFYTGSFSNMDKAFTGAALGGALTSALTTASAAPTSSSSSSGGGGGFSGGGGGGGGGGGW